jgi:DNA-binding transcriptional ArsR family regulator
MDAKTRLATQFQALADPTRLRVLEIVSRGLPSATDLNRALGMSQPRVAHHLKVLVDAGLVQARRDGRFVRYLLPVDPVESSLVAAALGAMNRRPGARTRETYQERGAASSPAVASGEGLRSPGAVRSQPVAGWAEGGRSPDPSGPASSTGPAAEPAPPEEPESETARPGLEDFLL